MLRRRSIRMRIIVLVLVPVVALIALYGVALSLTLSSYLSLLQAGSVRGSVSGPVTSLQSELTAERGLALGYLANPTHARLNILLEQEQDTDSAEGTYLSAAAGTQNQASAGERRATRTWASDLAKLDGLRATVVNVSLSRADAAQAYSGLISGGDYVVTQAVLPELTTSDAAQANDVLAMEQSLEAVTEERDVLSTDLASRTYPVPDTRLLSTLVAQHVDLWGQAVGGLSPQYMKYFRTDIPTTTSKSLASLEGRILSGTRNEMRISAYKWRSVTAAYASAFRKALGSASGALKAAGQAQASSALLRLLLVGGLGLLAIASAIAVAIILSRALLKQLDELRASALDLSSVRLPIVLARLRSGEEVDVEAETPRLEPGPSEIGQLGQAFNLAAQTAVAAAADEAEIRRGVNDVFRNLARRNQSLLTRQLEVLDAMERRVTDPEELADLFRVDHLTTRMRRHAEGLLIVAGGSSGRVWRDPVPVVDVMRAAAAEVEDYTRIRVASRSSGAVAGHAVADIIHMLAELVENATTFSPANTPVRIESDNVAKGLVVEIEDRGLGMTDTQIEEINSKLSNPPLLDLSGSEQLGLFIAGQLAQRHEVKITVRSSAYGGIIAVVLIPSSLVIEPGYDAPLTVVGIRELGGRPVPQLPAAAGSPDDIPETLIPAAYADGISITGYLVDLEAAATSITTTAAHVGTGPLDQVHDGQSSDELVSGDLVPDDIVSSYPAPENLGIVDLPSGDLAQGDLVSGDRAQRVPAWGDLGSANPSADLAGAAGVGTAGVGTGGVGTGGVGTGGVGAEGVAAAGADAEREPAALKGAGDWLVEAASADQPPERAGALPGAPDLLGDSSRSSAPLAFGTGPDSPKLILGPVTRFPGETAAEVVGAPVEASAPAPESSPPWEADLGIGTGPPVQAVPPDLTSDPAVTPIWSRLKAARDSRAEQIAQGADRPSDFGPADNSVGWPTGPSADNGEDAAKRSVGWPDRTAASADWLDLASSLPNAGANDQAGEQTVPRPEAGAPDFSAGPANGSTASPDEPVATGTIPLLPKRQARTADRSLGRTAAGFDRYTPNASDQPGVGDIDGLPVRVPQASLAPQLHNQPTVERPAAEGAPDDQEPSGVEPSPEAARSLMSALQQGWERGRSTAEQMTDGPDGTQQ
jgi:signal transduction histidine kinase